MGSFPAPRQCALFCVGCCSISKYHHYALALFVAQRKESAPEAKVHDVDIVFATFFQQALFLLLLKGFCIIKM
jgi:hypothetical protein